MTTTTPEIRCSYSELRPIAALVPNPRNPNRHPEQQLRLLAKVITHAGWRRPIVVSKRSGFIVVGHGRYLAAQIAGLETAPVDLQDYESEAAEWADMLADNRLAELAEMDAAAQRGLLRELGESGIEMELAGFTEDELTRLLTVDGVIAPDVEQAKRSLAERFGVPPFSVIDGRMGYWQERKRAWVALGLKSEIGREENLTLARSSQPPSVYALRNRMREETGRDPSWDEIAARADRDGIKLQAGTSIFDPVLCELVYRWFGRKGWRVLDPFAGGSVRGVVASRVGLNYTGIDLRGEQVDANRAQATRILTDAEPSPVWHSADSRSLDAVLPPEFAADLVFSCPPYADLEVYSEDPRDLSRMAYADFLAAYREIIAKACARLADDRFACFVVGEVRDSRGAYRNFVADTIAAFIDAGLAYYNEAIFITPAGSLPIRAAEAFEKSRKLGKTHQNILVFVKGSAKRAVTALGPCEYGAITDDPQEIP